MMSAIPVTSVSLLKDISSGAQHARWTEFYMKYERVMRGYLYDRFPSADADDAIQETMIALIKALPNYHYTPDEHGHFRNYLIGILKHKAMDQLSKAASQAARLRELGAEGGSGLVTGSPAEDDSWKQTVLEVAMEQLMSDQSVSARTREVFRHVAVMHEAPEAVARQFGITRNNVDQIKKRMIGRLSESVKAMAAEV